MLVSVLAIVAMAHAADVSITKTEINNVEVFPDDSLTLDVHRGDTLSIDLTLLALDDSKNVEVRAMVLGVDEDVEQTLPLFDITSGREYQKTISLQLPQTLDQKEYDLTVIIAGDNSGDIVQNYKIFANSNRHNLQIEDVVTSPYGRVQAGDYLFTTVRIKNYGDRDESDVRVSASIPDLDVQAVGYINLIKQDKEEDTEEMVLSIPQCAREGSYTMVVTGRYNEGRTSVVTPRTVFVKANPACAASTTNSSTTTTSTVTTGNVVLTPSGSSTQTSTPTVSTQAGQESGVKKVLEVLLLVLLALLVIIGLIVGFSKLRSTDE